MDISKITPVIQVCTLAHLHPLRPGVVLAIEAIRLGGSPLVYVPPPQDTLRHQSILRVGLWGFRGLILVILNTLDKSTFIMIQSIDFPG